MAEGIFRLVLSVGVRGDVQIAIAVAAVDVGDVGDVENQKVAKRRAEFVLSATLPTIRKDAIGTTIGAETLGKLVAGRRCSNT